MPDPITRYQTPAGIKDFPNSSANQEQLAADWDATLTAAIGGSATDPSRFYDPKRTAVPNGTEPVRVEWTTFPRRVEDMRRSWSDRFALADDRGGDPEVQNEYCEWCVERDPTSGKITRVTFTTETPEYYEHLWAVDPECVARLYRRHVHSTVRVEDLHRAGQPGVYDRRNKWNTGSAYLPGEGGSMHMMVGINTLGAAVGLVAGTATAPSPPDLPVGNRYSTHADPMVVLSVGRVVGRLGGSLSFSDPVGTYLQEPELNRVELPASAPASASVGDLWRVVRGRRDRRQGLRAVFSVPDDLGFTVSDVKIDGEPIRHGSQIARLLRSGTYVTPIFPA